MAQAEMRYLLAVYQLCEDGSEVRSVDVADFLDISRPSVAKQMKLLLEKGLIERNVTAASAFRRKGQGWPARSICNTRSCAST